MLLKNEGDTEKLAKRLVKLSKKEPLWLFFNDQLFLAIWTPVSAPATDFFS